MSSFRLLSLFASLLATPGLAEGAEWWGNNLCQSNSLPPWECRFWLGLPYEGKCWAGINTGQNAKGAGCIIPRPGNQCRLKLVNLVWQWSPSECCNCFQMKKSTDSLLEGNASLAAEGNASLAAPASLAQTEAESSEAKSAQTAPPKPAASQEAEEAEDAAMLQVAGRISGQQKDEKHLADSEDNKYCQANSLPLWDCKFNLGTPYQGKCWAGINTGQNAKGRGCTVPSKYNNCRLRLRNFVWQWWPETCCNCFQKKSWGSLLEGNASSANSTSLSQAAAQRAPIRSHSHDARPQRAGQEPVAEEGEATAMLQMPAAHAAEAQVEL